MDNDMHAVKQEIDLGCESPTQLSNTSGDSKSFLAGVERTSEQSETDILLQILNKVTKVEEKLITLDKKVDKLDNKLDSLAERIDRFEDQSNYIKPNPATSFNQLPSSVEIHHPILDKVGKFKSLKEISYFDKCIAENENKSVLIAFRQILDELGLSKTPTKFITSRMNRILGEKKISGYFRPMFMSSKMYVTLMESLREQFKFDMAESQANNSIINWFSNWGREKRQKESKSGQSSSEEQTIIPKEVMTEAIERVYIRCESGVLESPKNEEDKKSKRTRKNYCR